MGFSDNFNEETCNEILDKNVTAVWQITTSTKVLVLCFASLFGLLILFGLFIFTKYLVVRSKC